MTVWRGRFNDGRSATRMSASITIDGASLLIADAEGQTLASWPLAEILRVDEPGSDLPLRLRLRDDDGARLTLNDRGLADALRAEGLELGRIEGGAKRYLRVLGLGLLGACFLGVLLWVGVPALARGVASIIPVSWEVALGKRYKDQAIEAFALLADENAVLCSGEARRPLEALMSRLATASDSSYPFEVTLISLGLENAFALPGGQIVIFDGLLQVMEQPEELAAVLAHEMAHVLHRHGTEALIKSYSLSAIFGLLLGDYGEGFLADIGRAMVDLSYSRQAEAEADERALDLLAAAGVSGTGLEMFFARLAEREGSLSRRLSFLSTHPSSLERSAAAAKRAVEGAPGLSASEWAALKGICDNAQDS